MPNRILKESICRSDQINSLSPFEEVLFYRLIVNADDYGRFDGRVAIIKNLLFPLKESIRAEQIEKAIKALSSAELVACYNVDGKPFVRLTGWDRHQSIRAKKSKYPSPDDADKHGEATCEHLQSSESKCKQMLANVPVIQSESESESESESNAKGDCARVKARFTPPTPGDVIAYAQDKGLTLDAERFCDFYASKGWKVGSQPMKDWQAAVRNWCARDKQDASSPRGPTGKVLREQQYEQRIYEADSSVPDWMMRRMHEKEAGTA